MELGPYEELRTFFSQTRSRSSLIEVRARKGKSTYLEFFGEVLASDLYGVSLSVIGSDGLIRYFEFSGADLCCRRREKPFEQGWEVRLAGGDTFIFVELPQTPVPA